MRTLIRDVNVFDVHTATFVPTEALVLNAQQIEHVGAALDNHDADFDGVIDGRGGFVVPGLIDCHTHLCYDGRPDRFDRPTEPLGVLSLMATHALGLHLDAGVTTVRDCGSPDGVALAVTRAQELGFAGGPRVLAAGRVLTMTGGHGHQVGTLVDGVDSATRAVRTELAAGASFIKVMSTGGIVTKGVVPEQPALQLEEMKAIVRAAHDGGRKVTAHATGLTGARNAILAGVDSLEHGIDLDDEVIAMAVERAVVLVPTLICIERLTARADSLEPWMARKIKPQRGKHRASFRRALDAGVHMATGTDGGTPFNPHGALPEELALMVDAGMSATQALVAATWGSAQHIGLEAEVGSVAAGKRADLLLLEGDPTDDITHLRSLRRVIVGGEVHRPTQRKEQRDEFN